MEIIFTSPLWATARTVPSVMSRLWSCKAIRITSVWRSGEREAFAAGVLWKFLCLPLCLSEWKHVVLTPLAAAIKLLLCLCEESWGRIHVMAVRRQMLASCSPHACYAARLCKCSLVRIKWPSPLFSSTVSWVFNSHPLRLIHIITCNAPYHLKYGLPGWDLYIAVGILRLASTLIGTLCSVVATQVAWQKLRGGALHWTEWEYFFCTISFPDINYTGSESKTLCRGA